MLTGTSTRTITGYLVTLLEYPRWRIERDVDFTHCHLEGTFDVGDPECAACQFGHACRWLAGHRDAPDLTTPLPELFAALRSAVEYLRDEPAPELGHDPICECRGCIWLREAKSVLRMHRHRH